MYVTNKNSDDDSLILTKRGLRTKHPVEIKLLIAKVQKVLKA